MDCQYLKIFERKSHFCPLPSLWTQKPSKPSSSALQACKILKLRSWTKEFAERFVNKSALCVYTEQRSIYVSIRFSHGTLTNLLGKGKNSNIYTGSKLYLNQHSTGSISEKDACTSVCPIYKFWKSICTNYKDIPNTPTYNNTMNYPNDIRILTELLNQLLNI